MVVGPVSRTIDAQLGPSSSYAGVGNVRRLRHTAKLPEAVQEQKEYLAVYRNTCSRTPRALTADTAAGT